MSGRRERSPAELAARLRAIAEERREEGFYTQAQTIWDAADMLEERAGAKCPSPSA